MNYGKLRVHGAGINFAFDACRRPRIDATCVRVMHNRADGTREIRQDDDTARRSDGNSFLHRFTETLSPFFRPALRFVPQPPNPYRGKHIASCKKYRFRFSPSLSRLIDRWLREYYLRVSVKTEQFFPRLSEPRVISLAFNAGRQIIGGLKGAITRREREKQGAPIAGGRGRHAYGHVCTLYGPASKSLFGRR